MKEGEFCLARECGCPTEEAKQKLEANNCAAQGKEFVGVDMAVKD